MGYRRSDAIPRLQSQHRSDVVIGLDVGTTKICVIAGLKTAKGLKVLTVGSSKSKGLKKGIVVDVEATTESIVMALKEAEERDSVKVDSVYVGIAGGHIKSFNGYAVLEIRERKVAASDIERLIDMAGVAYVPVDREVLQIIPSGFSIDGVNGIVDPVGKKGKRLEAKVHIITGAITPVQNLIKCCEEAGLKVADIVLEPVASAEAVLTIEEKDVGTLMIDLGGGTTDLALFRDGVLRHTASLAIGGNHITNDIATGLDLTIDEAEKVKRAYGLVGPCDDIDIESKVPLSSLLSEIVYLRCEELFSLIKKEIVTFSGYKNAEKLPPYIKRIVLTGGTSLLKGIDRVAEKILGRQVRIGIPEDVTDKDLKNPIFSTGIGLVKLGLRSGDKNTRKALPSTNWIREIKSTDLIKPVNVIEKMKDWVTDFLNK